MATKGKRMKSAKKKNAKTNSKNKFSFSNNKVLMIAAIVIAVILAGGLIGGAVLGHGDTIHPGIVLKDIDLGGMTRSEAAAALTTAGWEDMDFGSVKVSLPAGYKFTVSAEEAGLTMDCKEAAQAAYDFGHSGNPVKDLFAYFKSISGKASVVDIVDSGESDALMKKIADETAELNKLLEAGYLVDEEKASLSMVKGAEKKALDSEGLCKLIVDALENGEDSVSFKLTYSENADCDFDKLHEEVYAEPVDAGYDAKTKTVVESSKGLDFDTKEAQKLWSNAKPGELVVIPLEITLPKYNLENFNGELFSDLLGTQSSNYSSSSSNRAANVELAASKINGVVLNPGESFSYNDTVGKRTEAAGFKAAGAYANGKVVNEVGGGICQVSSTLYCAVLYANLDVTARSCHYFPVSYLPSGLDATVSWGGPEFKFVNSRSFPIKIVAKCTNRTLTVEIWGTDLDGSYVEMNYSTSTVYEKGAAVGYTADTYRSVFAKDGTLISRTQEAHSYYHYHEEDIKRPESTTKPSESPEPTASPKPTSAPKPTQSVTPTPAPTPEPVETAAPEPTEPSKPLTPVEIIEEIIDNTPFE